MTKTTHGPWVDIHSHPGRCFLRGLPATSPFVQLLGAEATTEQIRSASTGEVAVVNAATVADLQVLTPKPDGGLGAGRDFEPGEARTDHDRQLDTIAALVDRGDIVAALGPEDVQAAHQHDRPGVFVSCEGGDFLEGELDGLGAAFEKGARSITLVHYRVNELGDIQTEEPLHDGLTDFGREAISEMNALGMIVDLAHATFEATVDALEVSAAPILISHSHLTSPGSPHPRLLTEEHARLVADNGGVIGAWPAGVALETLEQYCDEICRLVDVVGLDHVGIGTDLDANFRPVLTRYDQFPDIAAGLADRGMTVGEVDQILGGNFIRLWRDVVDVAQRLTRQQ